MEPLATKPLVVLASASPIVGELLGENRISVRHSVTGYASGPRRTSAPHRGHRPPPEKPDRCFPWRLSHKGLATWPPHFSYCLGAEAADTPARCSVVVLNDE